MKHHQEFQFTDETFEERIGPADESDAALGRIVSGFSFLEDSVRNVICLLLNASDTRVGQIVCAGIGFRQKLDVMASLVRHRLDSVTPDDGEFVSEWFPELLVVCSRAEQLRNTYIHSSYLGQQRAKTTIRGPQGLRTVVEAATSGQMLDVADYIVGVGMEVEGLPMLLGIADTVSGNGTRLRYTLADKEVATFFFGYQPTE
jgi:hypothetical protein